MYIMLHKKGYKNNRCRVLLPVNWVTTMHFKESQWLQIRTRLQTYTAMFLQETASHIRQYLLNKYLRPEYILHAKIL